MADTDDEQCIEGSCHCGNIGFAFYRPFGDGRIPVRVCGCSFCRKHGGRWTSHPRGEFTLRIRDHQKVTNYQFGTRSADFHICAICGVVPVVTCVLDGVRHAVVNVNSFNGIDAAALVEAAADFESEALEQRLARRRLNWTRERSAS